MTTKIQNDDFNDFDNACQLEEIESSKQGKIVIKIYHRNH